MKGEVDGKQEKIVNLRMGWMARLVNPFLLEETRQQEQEEQNGLQGNFGRRSSFSRPWWAVDLEGRGVCLWLDALLIHSVRGV